MSWITLADEVEVLCHLLTHDVRGPVNAVAPHPVTNASLSKALGRALHRPALVPVPAFGPRLVLGRQLADELLFASQRVRPAVLEDAGFAFHHPELDGGLAAVLGG
jgi:NAD dependent epimerase/dehydratase family enzyme